MALHQPPSLVALHRSESSKTVSIAQAARISKKHEATVRRWCKKGALPGAHHLDSRDAGPWVIPVTALLEVDWCSQDDLDQIDERLNPDLQQPANRIVDLPATNQ